MLENTPQSVAAALDAGAQRVEIDLQLSQDGILMVFHDWTLDCRTEGNGQTRAHTAAQLQQLDIGYGYTADGGRSFPFRGRFVGAMPTLEQLLDQFPQTRFLLDQKDPSERVTAAVIDVVRRRGPQAAANLCLQSTSARNAQYRAAVAGACSWPDKRELARCYMRYLSRPFAFEAPRECAGLTLLVPDWTLSRLTWGWPGTFVERMHAVGSRVLVLSEDPQRAEHYRQLGFDGVFTNHIERWAPAR
jgi:glycerophosphoryl diester phosphodiesterase